MDNKKEPNEQGEFSIYQCMGCALRVEGEPPEFCPKCGSQLSFSKVADWRFF